MKPMPDTCSTSITGIDSHAHVFSRGLKLAATRRYAPDYDATLAEYLNHLGAHGLSHGVLVQPSFLGTDNSYLLPALIHQLTPIGLKLVIDHFGRPDARLGIDQPGFSELLELGSRGSIWMKVSGIYRLGGTPQQNLNFARSALPLLEQSFGLHQL